MKASEARKLTNKSAYADKQFQKIIDRIKAEALKGKYELTYTDEAMKTITIDRLLIEGYIVKDYGYSQKDDINVCYIKW